MGAIDEFKFLSVYLALKSAETCFLVPIQVQSRTGLEINIKSSHVLTISLIKQAHFVSITGDPQNLLTI